MSETHKIEFTLDVDDIIAGYLVWMEINAPIVSGPGLVSHLTYLGVACIAVIEMLRGHSWAGWAVASVTLFYLRLISGQSSRRFRSAQALRSQLEQHPKCGLCGPHCLEITSDGLLQRTHYSQQLTSWAGFDRAVIVDDCLYICVNADSMLCVPRSRMTSGDFDAFVAALANHIDVSTDKRAVSSSALAGLARQQKAHDSRVRAALLGAAIGLLPIVFCTVVLREYVINWIPTSWTIAAFWLAIVLAMAIPGVALAAWIASPVSEETGDCRCRVCHHILRGLTEPRCPECGEAI